MISQRNPVSRSCPTCHTPGRNVLCSDAWHMRKKIQEEIAQDWTVDPETSRSNSSALFNRLTAEIERLIRQDAFKLIAGRADMTAGLIMAQLAHVHHLGPRPTVAELRAVVEAHEPEDGSLQWWVDDNGIDVDADEFWSVLAEALGDPAPPMTDLVRAIDERDMEAMVAAAQEYDSHWRPGDGNWTQISGQQAARLIEGALLYLRRQARVETKEKEGEDA